MIYRKATLHDAEAIYVLVNEYANKGMMLNRARSQLYENIRDFIVAEDQGEIIGAGALHVMWVDLAEVRTLAVHPKYIRQGIGKRIVELLLEQGVALGVKKAFTLTYQPEFFAACGFKEEDKNCMPQKVWTDCINCPKFPNCDEICMSRPIV
jgi:amino-acid N-acetyltransferase